MLVDVSVSRAYAEAMHARVLLAQDRLVEADVAASEARRLLRAVEWIPEGDAWVRLTRAEVWWAMGRYDDARAEIFTLRDLVLATAERIAEPEHRRAYLHRIEAHRRALELAERWSSR